LWKAKTIVHYWYSMKFHWNFWANFCHKFARTKIKICAFHFACFCTVLYTLHACDTAREYSAEFMFINHGWQITPNFGTKFQCKFTISHVKLQNCPGSMLHEIEKSTIVSAISHPGYIWGGVGVAFRRSWRTYKYFLIGAATLSSSGTRRFYQASYGPSWVRWHLLLSKH